jgi:hypothetical protein
VKYIIKILAVSLAILIGVASASIAIWSPKSPLAHWPAFQSWIQVGPAGVAAASAYATIEIAASALTQETTMNFSAGVVGVDNSGASRTDLWSGIQIGNASSTGTTNATLTSLTGAPSTAVITTAAATTGVIGITVTGGGTTGTATIATSGKVSCIFDGSTTAGDFVQISTGTNGDCHDTGAATCPTSGGQVIGMVLSTNGSGGTYAINLALVNPCSSGGGTTVTGAPPYITIGGTLYNDGLFASTKWNDSGATALNASTTTFTTETNGTVVLGAIPGDSEFHSRVVAAPSTPYGILLHGNFLVVSTAGDTEFAAVFSNTPTSTTIEVWEWVAPDPSNTLATWTGLGTSFGSSIFNVNATSSFLGSRGMWLAICDDGVTNLTYGHSNDGIHWIKDETRSRTADFTAGPTLVGFGYLNTGSSTMNGVVDTFVKTTCPF